MKKSVTVIVVAAMLIAFASCVDASRRERTQEPFREAFPQVVEGAAYI